MNVALKKIKAQIALYEKSINTNFDVLFAALDSVDDKVSGSQFRTSVRAINSFISIIAKSDGFLTAIDDEHLDAGQQLKVNELIKMQQSLGEFWKLFQARVKEYTTNSNHSEGDKELVSQSLHDVVSMLKVVKGAVNSLLNNLQDKKSITASPAVVSELPHKSLFLSGGVHGLPKIEPLGGAKHSIKHERAE